MTLDNMGNEIEEIGGPAKYAAKRFRKKRGGRLALCPDGTYDVYIHPKALFNFRVGGVAYYKRATKEKGITDFATVLNKDYVI